MKRCRKCGVEKTNSDFHKQKKSKDGMQPWCKVCSTSSRIQHYNNNKEKSVAYAAKRVATLKKYIAEYLSEHPCVDCGEDNIIVLDFDHVRGKKINNVTSMVYFGNSVAKIQEEIDKCEVRCANCHRKVTYYRRLAQSGRAAVLHTEG